MITRRTKCPETQITVLRMASALPPGVEKSSRAGAPRSRKPACLRGAIQVARDACRGTDHLCGASRWLPHGDWPNVLEAHLRDALLKLRDEVGKVLTNKANELKHQLARLEGETGNRGRHSSLNGRKVAVKYRDGSANAWAGRGAQPVWLREKMKAGAKLEDFAVYKSVAARKVSPKKSKTRRRAKR